MHELYEFKSRGVWGCVWGALHFKINYSCCTPELVFPENIFCFAFVLSQEFF